MRKSINVLGGRRTLKVEPASTGPLGVGVNFTTVFEKPLKLLTL